MGESYTRYLYELAQELGCGLRLEPDLAGMMYVEFGYVEGPHPETSTQHTPQQCFAVGLHELGHYALGHTQGRPPMEHLRRYFDIGVLQSEAEAWNFAFHHFSIFGEVIAEDTIAYMGKRCLGSYYAGAQAAGGKPGQRLWNGNRHHVAFTYDEPSEFFWEIYNRLQDGVAATAA